MNYTKSIAFIILNFISFSDKTRCHLEKKFVIIVCSYNNSQWYKKNLDSVFNQKYSNYSLIYVDDASTDGTSELVQNYIDQNNLHHKAHLVKNTTRNRKAKNIYNIYGSIDDKSIIVQLDGDDWFAHENVLSELNKVYSDNNIWMTYGQYKDSNSKGKVGYAKEVSEQLKESGRFRKTWCFMPTRTFYAWLFKLIKLQDCITSTIKGYKGKFFPAGNDMMIMYPMIEMARNNYKFLPDVSYIRNRKNPISGIKVDKYIQARAGAEIRFKNKPYKALKKPIVNRLKRYTNSKADLVIVSCSPSSLSAYLQNLDKQINYTNKKYILFNSSSKKDLDAYNQISQNKSLILINCFNKNILKLLKQLLDQTDSKHLLLLDSCKLVSKKIDVSKCIYELERTFAFAFYLNLNNNFNLEQINIEDNICNLNNDIYFAKVGLFKSMIDIIEASSISLHRKKDIITYLNQIKKLKFKNILKYLKEAGVKPGLVSLMV